MHRLPGLSQWPQLVSTHFPHLSRPQVLGLSLWSAGIVSAQRCGLTQVAVVLAYLLCRGEGAVCEQLRDVYRLALRRVGGDYEFAHRLMMVYLAELGDAEVERLAPERER